VTRRGLTLATVVALAATAACSSPGSPGPAGARAAASAPPTAGPARAADGVYRSGLDSLAAAVARLAAAVERPLVDPAAVGRARLAFAEARDAYKRVEVAVEAVAPSAAAELNGPALPEVEEEEGLREAIAPRGFQVVEAMLWPAPDPAAHDELRTAVGITAAVVERVRRYARATPLGDVAVLDAARQELARVAVLGVAGFDSPVAQRGLPEAAEALRGVRALLGPYGPSAAARAPHAWQALTVALDAGIASLDSAGADSVAFARYDRLRFVVAVANPAAEGLAEVRRALGVPVPVEQRLWRAEVPTLFAPGAFDPSAYAPGWAPPHTAALAALGASLFHDRRLSGDGSRSCASCHDPARAFADGRVRAEPLRGARPEAPLRNTPTLVNVALQAAQFAICARRSSRTRCSTSCATRPRCTARSTPRRRGRAATRRRRAHGRRARPPVGAVPAVHERDLRAALAAYLRTLVALDTRVDRALRGDTLALTAAERRGFTVFMGRASAAPATSPRCSTAPCRPPTARPRARCSACRGRSRGATRA
jgi:cytochrome c peroxidase